VRNRTETKVIWLRKEEIPRGMKEREGR